MSAATAVFGLVLVLLLSPTEGTAAFGWLLVALGALGVALQFLLPGRGQRR